MPYATNNDKNNQIQIYSFCPLHSCVFAYVELEAMISLPLER